MSQLNYKVTIFDLQDNNKGNKFYLDDKNINYIYGDTNNTSLLTDVFNINKFDGIIHLAAVSRVAVAQDNPEECIRTNVHGTRSLLEALQDREYEKKPWLVFGSSREVYVEPDIFPVKETYKKSFVNIYGDSKIQGENLFTEYARRNNHSCLILRFANVYGNEFDLFDRVIPRFIKAIANNLEVVIEGGEQVIDFTHIDDTVDTFIKAITYLEQDKETIIDDFHILPGVGWSLYEAIEYLENIINKKAIYKINPKRNYDVEKFVGDPTKIKNVLKSREFLSLNDGLKLAVPIYLEAMK